VDDGDDDDVVVVVDTGDGELGWFVYPWLASAMELKNATFDFTFRFDIL
jgi:hypothetical protein